VRDGRVTDRPDAPPVHVPDLGPVLLDHRLRRAVAQPLRDAALPQVARLDDMVVGADHSVFHALASSNGGGRGFPATPDARHPNARADVVKSWRDGSAERFLSHEEVFWIEHAGAFVVAAALLD